MLSQTTDLQAVLQAYLPWHKRRVWFLSAFILSLLRVMTVNLTRIAHGLNGHAAPASNYRRIQRFLATFELDYVLMAQVMLHLLPAQRQWVITMDRTLWHFGRLPINILLVGLVHRGVAFPLFWTVLSKQGNSHTAERIALMERVLEVVPAAQIQALVADREFIGQPWFSWLKKQRIGFAIRIRENALVGSDAPRQYPVRRLVSDLAVDQVRILRKPRVVYGHSLYLSGMRLATEYLLVVSTQPGRWALDHYRQRWTIECLFAAFKARGFDFESTHLNRTERIEKMVALLALTFAWAFLVGVWRTQHKPLKMKNHGYKAYSFFRYGADYLQYILLNIHQQAATFNHCLRLLSNPARAFNTHNVV